MSNDKTNADRADVFRFLALECATLPTPTQVRMQGDADDPEFNVPILALHFATAAAMREWFTAFNGRESKSQDNPTSGRRIFTAFGDFSGWSVLLHAVEPIPVAVAS